MPAVPTSDRQWVIGNPGGDVPLKPNGKIIGLVPKKLPLALKGFHNRPRRVKLN
jgi:hypothetical protein